MNLKILADLFITFCKIGSVSFGGGYAMLPMLERELADKKGWVTSDELMDYYAIGQSTPGIIAINVSTFCGYKTAGVTGAIVATLGMVVPSLVIIMLLAGILDVFDENPVVQRALRGVNIAVAVLLLGAVWKFFSKSVKNVTGLVLAIGACLSVGYLGLNPVIVLLIAIPIGLLQWLFAKRRAS